MNNTQQAQTCIERSFYAKISILSKTKLLLLLLIISTAFSNKTTAQIGSALNFDGVNDHVIIANPFTAFNKEITVEWWVKIETGVTYTLGSGIGQGTVNIDNMSNNVWLMHFNGSGSSMNFYVNDNGTWRTHSAVNIPTGWHHVVGVADANSTRLFIDGSPVGTNGGGIISGIWSNPNAQMHFGKDVRFNLNRFMPGSMDEIRVWNRALCLGEIQNYMNCELPGIAPGLQGNYHFNQGIGNGSNSLITVLNDASGNGRHGTLVNFGLSGGASNWITPGAVTNGLNCSTYTPPTASITASGSTTICNGSSVVLTAASGTGYTYQWRLNGNNIAFANSQSYTANQSGNYTVVVTQTGCSSVSAATTVTVLTADADGDNIADACDLDDDNDGILDAVECNVSNFYWSNPPSVSGNVATGTINGVAYTYTSSSTVLTTSNVFAHYLFPTSYNVPNNNPTIRNDVISNNTLSFASPMKNPVLVFSSIGNNSTYVPIEFNQPVEVLWSQNVTVNSTTKITGNEGYAIVRLNGTYSSIGFNYLANETYANFVFGADFQSCGDTDNDGTLDFVDIDSDNDGCADAVEGGALFLLSQTTNNRLNGGVNSQGIPLVAGTGQSIGTSKIAASNCSCQANIDRIPPSVGANNLTVQLDGSGQATITAAQVNVGSSDACGIASMTLSKTDFNCSNLGANTVTLTVTDNNGNFASTNVTITVIDVTSPTTIAQNLTVNLDASGNASITAAQINNGSSDNCGITSLTLSKSNFNCTNVGANVVTLTATDASGNYTSANATVTVIGTDTDADGVADPCDLDDDNDGITDATECNKSNFYWSNPPSVSGNVASGTINGIAYTYTSSVAVGTTPSVYNHSIYPSSYGVPNNNPTIRNDYISNNTLSFASPMKNPILVFSSIGNSGNYVPIEFSAPIEILWSTQVTKNSDTKITGNEGYAIIRLNGTFSSIGFNYLANESWVNFVFGADFTTCPDTDNDGTPDFADTDSDNDGCIDAIEGSLGLLLSQTSNGRLTGSVNAQGIPLVVGSGQGNGTSQSYAANCFCQPNIDKTAPTVVTKNVTVYLNNSGTATVNAAQVNDGSSDNCGISTYTLSKTSFNCSNLGDNTVTLTVTDINNNVATGTALVTVIDNIAPTISCQGNISSIATSAAGALINFNSPSSSDNCSYVITQTAGPASGSVFPIGSTTVSFIVTDASGNSNTCSFTVDVTGLPPVIVSPGNITASTSPTSCDAVVNFNATETTGIPASTITYSIAPGSVFNIGTTTVTATATNAVGSSQVSFDVIVSDNTAPTAIAQNLNINLDAAGNASITASEINYGSSDACGIANISIDKTTFNCSNVGANQVVLTVTDVNGNSSTANATVTVSDITPPIAIAQNLNINLDAAGNATITAVEINNGSSDACGIANISIDKSNFNCNNIGANAVILTVTDLNGNSSSASAIVNIADATAPIAIAQNLNINLDATGNASITATQINNGSSDACGIATISLDKTNFNCSNVGANTVLLTVTDVNGNSSTANAIVNIVDSTAPIAIAQNLNINLDAAGNASITASQINNGSSDACGIANISIDKTNFNCSNVGTNTVLLTVTDVNGNSSTAYATVNVIDNIAPIINPVINQSQCYLSSGLYTIDNISANDNCSIVSSSFVITGATNRFGSGLNASGTFNIGTSTITWTVTDASNNTSTSSADFTVYPLPVASIVSSGNNTFCNEITLTANSSLPGNNTFMWSTGETTQSITLGATDADGQYYVYVISENGCNSAIPATYNYQKQNLVNSYTILAKNEVELKGTNTVQSGSIGVMHANGEAEFEKGVSIVAAGSFTKSPKYKIKNTVNISNKITGVANVSLPNVEAYTGSTHNLPSYTVNKNTTVTLNSNYKDLTVKKGGNATINGSVFRKVTIEEGATVRFTSPVVNIENLNVGTGGNAGTIRIRFAGNTTIRIRDNVRIEGNCIINQDNYIVTFHFASNSGCQDNDEDKFYVKGGNTIVTANVLIPGGKIKVENHGKDDDGCNGNNNVGTAIYMTGLYVGDKVKGEGNNIYWNSFNCSNPASNREAIDELANSSQELLELNLLVYPNPAAKNFNFKVETISADKITFRVFDLAGRMVYENSEGNANEIYTLGDLLAPGTYIVEAIQNDFKKMMKIVKTE